MNENMTTAYNALIESVSIAEDTVRHYMNAFDLYNDLMRMHDKLLAYCITEQELVTLMLLSDQLRDIDAFIPNCINMECLELIRFMRLQKEGNVHEIRMCQLSV